MDSEIKPQVTKNAKFNFHFLIFLVIVVVFAFYTTYLAINLQPGIVPDEPYRYEVSQYFAQTWGVPEDVPIAVEYGDNLSRNPYLGYWFFGRILNLETWICPECTETQQLVWLRIVNSLFAIGTLIFTYLLSKELIRNPWIQLLPPFLLANTLMFVFLSGGVSYDNPTNLACAAGIYFLVRVLNGKNFLANSLGWLIGILFAALIKYSVLPLLLFTGVIWVIFIIRHKGILKTLKPNRWGQYLLLTIAVGLVALNIHLYGVNLIRFQSLTPNCTDTYSFEVCQESVYGVRHTQLGLPEKLSLSEAIRQGYPEPVRYFFDVWVREMLKRTFGIMGHKNYYPIVISYFQIALYWLLMLGFRYVKKIKFNEASLILLTVA